NQRDGQMTYVVDGAGENTHVNYQPSQLGGLAEADESYREYRPFVSGQLGKQPLPRTNDYAQAGERIRSIEDWEREDLLLNLTTLLGECEKQIQERMVAHFTKCDDTFGGRLAEGLGIARDGLDIDALVDVRPPARGLRGSDRLPSTVGFAPRLPDTLSAD